MAYNSSDVLGGAIYVQSAKKDPEHCSMSILKFLREVMRPLIGSISEGQFITALSSVTSRYEEPDKNLHEKFK